MFVGLKELILILFRSFNLKNSKKINEEYSIYPNLNYQKLNLGTTKVNNSKLFNVVRWCDDYFSNTYSVFFSKKKF